MTRHVVRLYALVVGVLTFFLVWALVAAHPWSASSRRASRDPRLIELVARRRWIERESSRVQIVVARRWAIYRKALRARNAAIARVQRQRALAAQQLAVAPVPAAAPAAAAPARIVTLPPLVITRTS
ncbi:MAG TPA: hypothetical protein VF094_08940 [Gaiellaceae bacterium]